MAHQEQYDFLLSIRNKFPEYFVNKKVLDCGSLDINGNFRHLFQNCVYIGIDLGEGKNVDVVSTIHEFNYPDANFDTIISGECFEHDMYYEKSLKNICRLLKPASLFLFTCATIGRPEHGTTNIDAWTSPLTSSKLEWNTYYKNLEEKDIRNAINIDGIFSQYEFKTRINPCDLYFWGIKIK